MQLRRVQLGLEPTDWKPVPSVGLGVREIRVRTELEHRVLYVARFEEALYVLHAFDKRSRKTSKHDIELAGVRMRRLQSERSQRNRR